MLKTLKSPVILTAVTDIKTEFSTRFDGISSTIENVRKDITDCAECVTEVETRVLTAGDFITSPKKNKYKSEKIILAGKTTALGDKIKTLKSEARHPTRRGSRVCLSGGLAAEHTGSTNQVRKVDFGVDEQNWAKNAKTDLHPEG